MGKKQRKERTGEPPDADPTDAGYDQAVGSVRRSERARDDGRFIEHERRAINARAEDVDRGVTTDAGGTTFGARRASLVEVEPRLEADVGETASVATEPTPAPFADDGAPLAGLSRDALATRARAL